MTRRRVLDELDDDECRIVLRALLLRHPGLADEAEEVATRTAANVDRDAVAEEMTEAAEILGLDDLNAHAGCHQDAYTPPADAAYDLLMEPLEAHFDEIDRLARIGLEHAAMATCEGVLLGLYRWRYVGDEGVLAWAPDFAAEAADLTVSRWLKAKGPAKGGRRLTDEFVEQVVPGWSRFLAELQRRRDSRQ